MIKFIFNPNSTDYGSYSNGTIVINLSYHHTIIRQVVDTIVHESIHQAIDSVFIDTYNTFADGEEDVVKQLTEWSLD